MKTNKDRLEFIKNLPDKPWKEAKINGISSYSVVDADHIGNDGFGFEWDGERLIEFPQRGDVYIGKDVRIGECTCIDRATLEGELTVIGDGTKIDNLVHIAHNCKIGKHNLIAAGAVLCGGVETGDCVYIGAGAMIKQKVKIGEHAVIGIGAVVLKDVPAHAVMVGNPAKILRYE